MTSRNAVPPAARDWFMQIRFALSLIPRNERGHWAGLTIYGLAVSGLEAISALAVFSLVRILVDPTGIADLAIHGIPLEPYLRAGAGRIGISDPVVALALVVAIFYAFKSLFTAYVIYRQASVPLVSGAIFSRGLFAAYMHAPYAYHLHKNSAEILRNVGTAVDAVFRTVLYAFVTAISELLMMIGLLAVLCVIAPLTTLVSIGVLAIMTYGTYRLTQGNAYRWGAEVQTLSKTMIQSVSQGIGGLKEIRVAGREKYFIEDFAQQRARHARLYALYTAAQQFPRLMLETCFVAVVVLILIVSKVGFVAGHGILPLLGLYAYAGFRVMPSLNRILISLQSIKFGAATMRDVHADFTILARGDVTAAMADAPLPFERELALHHLGFNYPQDSRRALRNIDLVIRRGESVGIVGATGAGKSTLLDIILGLLEPDSGSVTVDGRDIHSAIATWQKQIGYVPQMVYLFDDTLKHNIALGVPDDEIDLGHIDAAIRSAQLEDVVAALPDGLDTMIGERGIRLSGGQRQRVAIARALYRRPEVLVLDEATAALDNRTELYLSEAVQKLSGTMTVIIVAHRLNTIRNCGRIIVMKDGAIVDSGTYDDLVKNSATFRDIASHTVEKTGAVG